MARLLSVLALLLSVIGFTRGVNLRSGGDLVLTARSSKSVISSPYGSTSPGCSTLTSLTVDQLNKVTELITQSDGSTSYLGDVWRPIVEMLKTYLTDVQKIKGLDSNFCLGSFSGKDILNAPIVGANNALMTDKCSKIPVDPAGQWTVFAINLPLVAPINSICTAGVDFSKVTSIAGCMVIGVDKENIPTASMALNGGAIQCGLAAATGGAAKALAFTPSFDALALGLSPTSNLIRTFNVVNEKLQKVSVTQGGNIALTSAVTWDAKKLGIDGAPFYLYGSAFEMYSFLDEPSAAVMSLAAAHDFEGYAAAIGSAFGNFGVSISGNLFLAFQLKELTKGAIPDVLVKLFDGAAFINGVPKSSIGVSEGFYLYLEGQKIANSVVQGVIGTLVPTFGQVLDKIFGAGTSAALVANAKPNDTPDTALAVTINSEGSTIYVKAPIIGGLAGSFELTCLFKPSGDSSCKFNYDKSAFINTVTEGALLVTKEAKEFFDDAGKIIASVKSDLLNCDVNDPVCILFSAKNIQNTAQQITKGLVAASQPLKDWAKEAEGWCGFDTVTSIGKCGKERITDGAKCGWSTVSSGAICGWDWIKNIFSGDFSKKPKSCQVANSCDIPATCTVAVTC